MDDGNPPPNDTDAEKAQIEARRRERRARRKMRQAMADAALTAAAESARAEGFTLQGGKDPSFDRPEADDQAANARSIDADTQAGRAGGNQGQDNGGNDDSQQPREAPRMTELARIKPTSIQAPSASASLAEAIPQDNGFAAAQAARDSRMRDIRKELRRRRRLRTMWILLRFLIFVILPTAAVGWYYFEKATDMYVSVSALVFKGGAATGGESGSGGGLFGGAAGPVSNPAVDLQEFILSRDMLKRLDEEHDYIAHFQSEDIDEFHRLAADASFDDAYSYYKGGLLLSGKIEVSYDLTEGIIRMEVVGASSEAAQRFSEAIIAYGEQRVNDLNDRSRNDGVRLAEKSLGEAKQGLVDAQLNVNTVQEEMEIFSTQAEADALQGRILQTEQLIDEVRSQIRKLETVAKDPNDSRYIPLRLELRELQTELDELRSRLTGSGNANRPSLSELNSRMALANIELLAANQRYSAAITSMEMAIQSASAQSLYLETVVAPNLAEDSSRPDRVTSTALVFLILFAAYIIGLLTISVIREQAAI